MRKATTLKSFSFGSRGTELIFTGFQLRRNQIVRLGNTGCFVRVIKGPTPVTGENGEHTIMYTVSRNLCEK